MSTPSGIGSTSEGSESVKRSAPIEQSRSWRIRNARIGGASRGNVPPLSGCENGKLQVEATPSLTTAAPSSSASSASSASAFDWATASPATRIGRSARTSRRAASSIAARSPTRRGATRVDPPRSMSRSAFSTSTGSERNTGPVGWASAVLTARRTMRGRSSSRWASVDHFT